MKWATIEQADAVSVKSNPQDSVAALTVFLHMRVGPDVG